MNASRPTEDDWRSLLSLASPTEERNPRTGTIDLLDSAELVRLITAEDRTVTEAVAAVQAPLAALVDLAVQAIRAGGRVHYVGAGTSGRLGVLDAAELAPTYGVGTEWFVAHLAGGPSAMVTAVEGAEDDPALGAAAVADIGATDLVVGIAASGRTPYVAGALEHARAVGARTALVSANPGATLARLADVAVLVDTGPEVVTGSTRMKAATAQKLVLNTFSTATLVRLGRTFSNLMIDVRATNRKLRARTVRMLVQATGRPAPDCERALLDAGQDVRTALVTLLADVDPDTARAALDRAVDPDRGPDPSGVRTAVAALTGTPFPVADHTGSTAPGGNAPSNRPIGAADTAGSPVT